MNITEGIEIIDLALFIDKRILVVSDFHLGYESSMQNKGVLIPKFQLKDTIKRLESIFLRIPPPEKIIINGDLKHEFHTITNQEWSDVTKLIQFLRKHCKELIIIKGNHDNIVKPIAEKRNVKLIKEYREKGLLIIHGDEIPEKLEDTIIIGHEHPAVSLQYEGRVEKYKCFLKGAYKRKKLIVCPSFNVLTEGSDILSQEKLSPLLKGNIKKFRVFIVGDDIYDFGIIGNILKK